MASNADLVRDLFARLNDHDTESLGELWAADGVERFPDGECRGAEEITAYFRRVFAALPDYHMEIEALVEQGDEVFARWHLTGTHTGGGFQGLDATGKAIELDGIDHITVRDGKLVSNFVVFDQMQFARALGLLPPDGSIADKAVKSLFNAKTKVADLIAQQRGASS
jgi:steroid delta-isomerase-like uncharacterized protein